MKPASGLLPFFGITPAPSSVTHTNAEEKADQPQAAGHTHIRRICAPGAACVSPRGSCGWTHQTLGPRTARPSRREQPEGSREYSQAIAGSSNRPLHPQLSARRFSFGVGCRERSRKRAAPAVTHLEASSGREFTGERTRSHGCTSQCGRCSKAERAVREQAAVKAIEQNFRERGSPDNSMGPPAGKRE